MQLGNFIVLILGILLYLYSGYCFYKINKQLVDFKTNNAPYPKLNVYQDWLAFFFVIITFGLFIGIISFTYGYLNQFNI